MKIWQNASCGSNMKVPWQNEVRHEILHYNKVML